MARKSVAKDGSVYGGTNANIAKMLSNLHAEIKRTAESYDMMGDPRRSTALYDANVLLEGIYSSLKRANLFHMKSFGG